MFIHILVSRLSLPLLAFILFLRSLSGYQIFGLSIAQALVLVHLWTMFFLCDEIESKQYNLDIQFLIILKKPNYLFLYEYTICRFLFGACLCGLILFINF